MKTRKASVVGCCAVAILSMQASELVWAGTEIGSNTFYGQYAGYSITSGNSNSFFGTESGLNSTTGSYNTFVWYTAGLSNQTGTRNVFLGFGAGDAEMGSNKLYI